MLWYFPRASFSSASHSHWEALPAGLAVRMKCTQALAGLEQQWLSAVCKRNSLSARTPALHETCCPGKSCLWTIQICPGPLAVSELLGSSIWMSFWLSWQSLSLKSCLQTAAFTDCSCVARTCRNRLGCGCTNASFPTKQPDIVLAPQLKHQARQRLGQWFCFTQ